MRKEITLAVALALLAAMCACSDKSSEDELIGDITTAVDTESVTELKYSELTEDDFTPVDIACDITDSAPPVEIHVADLSEQKFGERMSPCKILESVKTSQTVIFDDAELQKRYDAALDKLLATPCKGMVGNGVFLDDKFIFSVNFDDLCSRHDSSLYSYDVKSGNFKELITHTGIEYEGAFDCLTVAHGRLFYSETAYYDENDEKIIGYEDSGSADALTSAEHGEEKSVIYSVDTQSGAEEKICSIEGHIHFISEGQKGLVLHSFVGGDIPYKQVEYDFDTKEIIDLKYEPELTALNVKLCDGVPAEVTGGFDGEKYNPITVKTQYYTVSTDLNYYTDIFLWKDKFSILSSEQISGTWLYTYDLTNHEKLSMKLDGLGYSRYMQAEDGIVIISNVRLETSGINMKSGYRIHYVLPVLGTVYRLQTCDNILEGTSGNTFYYLTTSGGNLNYDDEYFMFVGYNTMNGMPDKLYWFE